jgi:multidrug efflux pump subunit AcrB
MYNPEKILHAPKPITYKLMQKVEKLYIAFLNKLLFSTKNKIIFLSSVLALFLVSILLVFPLIKKEIIGKPDSDWMIVNINSPLSKSIFQVEKKALEIEHIVFKDFPDKFKYSFVQIQSKIRATLMFRLQNKKEMNHLWKEIEKKFSNTPEHHFWVGPWNPAELPLPNPPDTKIIISGMNQENKELLADRILYKIKEQDIFDRVHAEPSNSKDDQIEFYPYQEYWDRLQGNFQLSDLFHITRLMNKGENITNLDVDGLKTDINMYYQSNLLNSTQDLKSLYIPYNNQLLPFEALGEFKRTRENSNIKRHNGQSVIEIIANQNRDKKSIKYEKFQQIKNIITENPEYFKLSGTHISMEDPDFTFNDSYSELQKALAISLFLIFFILLLQFQNFIDVFSIMLAIPLGLIGVSFSLFIFDSTLSLNSCLGIILLNGICVNNSLLLIDFCRKLQKSGIDIKFAMLEACKKRLRPILITSLTTIMGMLPIAFAYGDGGSILQPLGIAVSGGLGISTILTLVCIPIIYTSISSNKEIRPQQVKNNHPIPEVENQL